MRKQLHRGKADPELLRQLEAAASAKGLVQAVFMLRLPAGKQLTPKRIEQTARQVLDRVARSVGTAAIDVNVFGNLGAFAVRAAPPFVRALLGEPEIASAVANKRPEELLIRPRGKRRIR
jgi:hypothetical protein